MCYLLNWPRVVKVNLYLPVISAVGFAAAVVVLVVTVVTAEVLYFVADSLTGSPVAAGSALVVVDFVDFRAVHLDSVSPCFSAVTLNSLIFSELPHAACLIQQSEMLGKPCLSWEPWKVDHMTGHVI